MGEISSVFKDIIPNMEILSEVKYGVNDALVDLKTLSSDDAYTSVLPLATSIVSFAPPFLLGVFRPEFAHDPIIATTVIAGATLLGVGLAEFCRLTYRGRLHSRDNEKSLSKTRKAARVLTEIATMSGIAVLGWLAGNLSNQPNRNSNTQYI